MAHESTPKHLRPGQGGASSHPDYSPATGPREKDTRTEEEKYKYRKAGRVLAVGGPDAFYRQMEEEGVLPGINR